MIENGLKPLERYQNSYDPWRCQCLTCGAEVTPRYYNIRGGWGGCSTCSPGGFDPAKPALVYLVTHESLGAAKVGICQASGPRLSEHVRLGWRVLASERVPGERAIAVEKAVLSWWRVELGLPPFLGREEMPQGGWTETVDLDAIDVAATVDRIRTLATREATECVLLVNVPG